MTIRDTGSVRSARASIFPDRPASGETMRRVTMAGLWAVVGCHTGPETTCDAQHLPDCQAACTAGVAAACDTYADTVWPGDAGAVADPPALRQVIERSCELDDGHGCQILGQASHQGNFGLPQDDARAVELWSKSCDRKWPIGCRWLGWAYQAGWAVKPNEEKAREHMQQACDLGEQYGCTELGWVLVNLDRVGEALPIWQKGCDAKDGESCRGVAWAYANGRGVAADPVKARQIAELGCGYTGGDWSCGLLGWYLIEGTGGDKDIPRGRDLMGRGCSAGFTWACTTLDGYAQAESPFKTGG